MKGSLIKEVDELPMLHQFDKEWICKLPPDKQMAAALKCIDLTNEVKMLNDNFVVNRIKKLQSGSGGVGNFDAGDN